MTDPVGMNDWSFAHKDHGFLRNMISVLSRLYEELKWVVKTERCGTSIVLHFIGPSQVPAGLVPFMMKQFERAYTFFLH
jgi:hypothetical protein